MVISIMSFLSEVFTKHEVYCLQNNIHSPNYWKFKWAYTQRKTVPKKSESVKLKETFEGHMAQYAALIITFHRKNGKSILLYWKCILRNIYNKQLQSQIKYLCNNKCCIDAITVLSLSLLTIMWDNVGAPSDFYSIKNTQTIVINESSYPPTQFEPAYTVCCIPQ